MKMLTDTYLIIDKTVFGDRSAAQIVAACIRGIRLIRLREFGLTPAEYLTWITELVPIAQQQGAKVLIDRYEYLQVGADGWHLTSEQLQMHKVRPLANNLYLAASTHDLAELQQAEQLAVDFATLSPVNKTLTHPGAKNLGWPLFSQWARQVNCPVFALGGLTLADKEYAKEQGAFGIAGIRGIVS